MLDARDELESRAQRYAANNGMQIGETLGFGVHGIVFGTTRKSAIKIHARDMTFHRERDVYLRLRRRGISQIRQFAVPKLVQYDDDLWVIEMGIVAPPFLLDFAGAYLDQKPPYWDDVDIMAEWEAEKREQFAGTWPEVQRALSRLESLGIFLADISPNNIRC